MRAYLWRFGLRVLAKICTADFNETRLDLYTFFISIKIMFVSQERVQHNVHISVMTDIRNNI